MNFRDAEDLSAYLDGQLDASEHARLERRLAVDAGLRQLLDDLRVARGLLRRVPRRAAPRNFTLSPLNAKVRAPQPRAVPVLRLTGALATFLFLLGVGVNTLSPIAARSLAAAPAPGYGMGGGAGGADPTMEALMLEGLATPGAEAPMAQSDLAAPTAEPSAKTAPPAEQPAAPTARGAQAPIPAVWEMVLAAVGVVLVALSIYLDRLTRRKFRSKLIEK